MLDHGVGAPGLDSVPATLPVGDIGKLIRHKHNTLRHTGEHRGTQGQQLSELRYDFLVPDYTPLQSLASDHWIDNDTILGDNPIIFSKYIKHDRKSHYSTASNALMV